MSMRPLVFGVLAALLGFVAIDYAQNAAAPMLRGKAAFGAWRDDAPGKRRHITADELPAPYASPSRSNGVRVVARPRNAELKVPAGFEIKLFASGLQEPRLLRVAPNGDIFVAESSANRIRVLRPNGNGTGASATETFASGLSRPFGIAFYPADDPQWVYVANTNSVVRFPYRTGDMKARGAAEVIVPKLPSGGHWTRDVAFSKNGTKMLPVQCG